MINRPLQSVDFIATDGEYTTGLVPVSKSETSGLSIDEQAAVFDALSFKHINFIFFRRFSDGRSSQILAYIVDNSEEKLTENVLAELHLQVWLHGVVPLLYIAWPSRIDILACVRGPDFWEAENDECQYSPARKFSLDPLNTAGAIDSELQKFSALRLADGTFWEDPGNKNLAAHEKAAHYSLIQAVVEADRELDRENNPILRRLLLLMVLIKYLEDRKVFPNDGWFGRFHKGAKNFFEVLKGHEPDEVHRLLDFLKIKFNGDIFTLPHEEITKPILETFSGLVEAKTLSNQRYLWKQFSFEHLPVEIISHLYQRFVQGGHGTVYTPPLLASLLLDHSMPYNKLTGMERILDPACGSGVFLVGAFRRLVNIWRSQNNWQRPDVETLKKILKRSIYGIELDSYSIDLTSFSLALAICDALQPDVIWRDLKFDPLRNTNLVNDDFFNALSDSHFSKERFDLIIGNPPFESSLSSYGEKVDESAQALDKSRGKLPDNQIAYLFLEQAFTILNPQGQVCLIQPSGFLYNSKTFNFRNSIFRKHQINTILDFTSIRNLYEADPKTIAICAKFEEPSKGHLIAHWTFRRTISVKERICFELDHYDRHRVLQKEAEMNLFIWRVNLLGGGRLLDISKRLQKMRTLADYIKKQKGWKYSEGFISGTGKKAAPFLTGKPYLPTDAFTDSGINESEIQTVTEKFFVSPKTEDQFTPPLILIKENELLPIVFWDKGFLAYRHKIVGIHAPKSQASELRSLYKYLKDTLEICKFSCILNGSQILVGKATVPVKQDFDRFPYPKDSEDLIFSFWEQSLCEDVLNYMAEYVRLGQTSKLLQTTAEIKDIQEYSDMFIRMLGSVYDDLHASTPIFLNGLICQPFYFGIQPKLTWLNEQSEDVLRKLIYHQNYESLRTVRLLRLNAENVLLIIKPDRLRYWIRSTAIQDADETLIDLRRQGY